MAKLKVMNSMIGFKPPIAAPAPRPAKPYSVIGVSITRFGPELVEQALGDLVGALILRRLPRPSRTRARRARISSAMASRSASRTVMLVSGVPSGTSGRVLGLATSATSSRAPVPSGAVSAAPIPALGFGAGCWLGDGRLRPSARGAARLGASPSPRHHRDRPSRPSPRRCPRGPGSSRSSPRRPPRTPSSPCRSRSRRECRPT